MDKLYTPPKFKNTPAPKSETLQLIRQFAASYVPFQSKSGLIEFISN